MSVVEITGNGAEPDYEVIRNYDVRGIGSNDVVSLAALCMLEDNLQHIVLFKGKISIGKIDTPKTNLDDARSTYPNMRANDTIMQLIELATSSNCYLGVVPPQRKRPTLEGILPALTDLVNRQPAQSKNML